jgi:hypothetical protein
MLDKYLEQWGTVQEAPSDFNTWTALISTAEKLVGDKELPLRGSRHTRRPGAE